nr:immunoglobulin light chain junction region [Macaca mulatta]
CYQHSTGWTF